MPIDRRHLLQLACASATALWLPRSAWAAARLPAQPFALGVASGSPTHDSVVLWTRLVDGGRPLVAGPVTVRWEIADDEAFHRIVRHGQAQALPELAHAVHVEAEGLASDRWYFYRFMTAGAVSATGRTRTFPAPGAAATRLRLAYASCQRWEHGHYGAWRHLRTDEPDAVLFLGDYIYEYPGASDAVRKVRGGWTVTLDDYRARHALYRSDPHLQAMHAACPWLVTWDDHEVQNDQAGRTPGNSGPAGADYAARRIAAYQAYYEHLPLRASVLTRAIAGLASGAELRLYASVRFGTLAALHLLDDRQYRDPQACTPGGRFGAGVVDTAQCPEWNDPARTLLGAAQERWIDARLAERGATWNVIGQQTLFGRRDFAPGKRELLANDGWDGYPAARGRMLAALQRHGTANPVILGGDIHQNWVGHVKADYGHADSRALGVEFCGTSISSRAGTNEKLPQRLAANPHFVFADAERRGYGLVDFTPRGLLTTLRTVDDVTREDTGISTLARFAVQAGRPVLEPA
ncbi:MAG: alkaline phosphatase D family protein [Burkholderiaceae bacterium]|nr:alkaline phosphatase D family protein [Burkholderiaceae bacterium]